MSLAHYATPHKLKDRLSLHERFGAENEAFHSWLFRQVQAPRVADVLEVGCGSGHMWAVAAKEVPEGWTLTLTDPSAGMLDETRRTLARVGLRALLRQHSSTAMPYPDASFDVAFANHMLYLVPIVEDAIAELRRILKPGGRLYAATNGARHMERAGEELEGLLSAVPELEVEPIVTARFSLESGKELLAEQFEEVRVFERRDTLVVDDVEPYVRYVLSLVNTPLEQVLADADAAQRYHEWRAGLEARFAESPVFVQRVSGFFEAF